MPLDDAALQLMANALDAAITHVRFHSADPGSGETSALGAARQAIAFTADADGDLTLDAPVSITGLAASQAVTWVTLWSASTAGTRYGKFQLTGDTAANASGEFNLAALTITGTAS
jgi:hypothetical protein